MSTSMRTQGIHHITAIAGDPQRNVRFYTDTLGLRLVKKTVNFDDPGTYHLYYGDETGQPGAVLTFFPFVGAGPGRQGAGQATAFAFAVPPLALATWAGRLADHGVTTSPLSRFGQHGLAFTDPDGLPLELVADEQASQRPGWAGGPVPAQEAIRGFHSVTLTVRRAAPTAAVLTDALGLTPGGQEGALSRFDAQPGALGGRVYLLEQPDAPRGLGSAGTVHHIAFRADDDTEQQHWQDELSHRGLSVSPVMDRAYFHSIYFREPGGVLFELATDPPGFTVDEPLDSLGTRLMLPRWLEPRRADVERYLPPLAASAQPVRS